MLAEAVRFERTCPEGAVAFQATELPVAQRLRMEESNGIEPSSPEGSAGTQDRWRTIRLYSPEIWRKGRVSNPHVPKDRPASNGPPLGRSSAYLSVLESRPGLEPGKIGFAARRLDRFGIRLLAPQG
jgi:hypothetical protein